MRVVVRLSVNETARVKGLSLYPRLAEILMVRPLLQIIPLVVLGYCNSLKSQVELSSYSAKQMSTGQMQHDLLENHPTWLS